LTSDRFKKGLDKAIGEHFLAREFDCPCEHCDYTLIDEKLVRRLDLLRKALGVAIQITSAFRCDHYQAALAKRGYETAKGLSTHQLGKAVDICVKGYSGVSLEKPARAVGFRAVGVGSNFVHLDTRSDKDRAWTYHR
jgi:uncharacterized protein YcbK (DUF882 family)